LPQGTFAVDPSSAITYVPATNLYRTVASPRLAGPNGGAGSGPDRPHYDATTARWLPVSVTALSPDGSGYAYARNVLPPNVQGPVVPSQTLIHVVNIRTALDRVVYNGPLRNVVGWRREGIYLTIPCIEGCGQAGGLWLLNPANGHVQQLISPQPPNPNRAWALVWSGLGGGAAWAIGIDPSNQQLDRLVRHDLNGGPETVWFIRAGGQMSLLGIDAGKPIVAAQSDAKTEIWLVTARDQGHLVW
jgi:hypothetical protein